MILIITYYDFKKIAIVMYLKVDFLETSQI